MKKSETDFSKRSKHLLTIFDNVYVIVDPFYNVVVVVIINVANVIVVVVVVVVVYRVADGNVGRVEDGVPEVEWQPADTKDGPDPT